MEENRNDGIVKLAAVLIVGPAIIAAATFGGALIFGAVGKGISKIQFNKKIKKGLKDGSIVEVDGQYYEVEKVIKPEEEA